MENRRILTIKIFWADLNFLNEKKTGIFRQRLSWCGKFGKTDGSKSKQYLDIGERLLF